MIIAAENEHVRLFFLRALPFAPPKLTRVTKADIVMEPLHSYPLRRTRSHPVVYRERQLEVTRKSLFFGALPMHFLGFCRIDTSSSSMEDFQCE